MGHRTLSVLLVALGLGIATSSLLGDLGLGVMRYRTSPTTLNQLIGGDAAALFVIAPLCLVAAALAAREHPIAPLLGLGIAAYSLYTYAQVIIGQEYLRLPGNIERFFPLLLTVFILAEMAFAVAWQVLQPLPRPSLKVERTAGVVLLLLAVFLVFGQHLRPILAAWTDPGSLTEYASSPTPFWMVKLMDLGIVVPAAIATGVGLLCGQSWARRAMYVIFTAYSCLAISVAAMGIVMNLNDDPDASPTLTGGFVIFALIFVALTVLLYRPLFRQPRSARGPVPAEGRGVG